jgi:hypothetical protein
MTTKKWKWASIVPPQRWTSRADVVISPKEAISDRSFLPSGRTLASAAATATIEASRALWTTP